MKIEKSKWGEGPWQSEPDRIEFEHAGLPCLMRRGSVGAWCGYAAVPPGHPLHGKGYSDDAVEGVDVHGGLTYAGACSGDICHVPKPGEPDDVWWFGFDTGHSGDLPPMMQTYYRERNLHGSDTYRDAAYVRRETEHLAEQLAAVKAS